MWHPHTDIPDHLTGAVIAIASDDDEYPKPLLLSDLYIYRHTIGWQCETTDAPLTADRFWWFGEHELIDLIPTD